MTKAKKVAVLAGDGIGPEVMHEALRVLKAVSELYSSNFEFEHGLIGGAAFDVHSSHCPAQTIDLCKSSDAVLFGSVGGPANSPEDKWKNCEANSILALRKEFSFNANFRPAHCYPQLSRICPLKDSLTAGGVDVLIVRELIGDIYFGEHKLYEKNGKRYASDVAEYNEDQIASVARLAFEAASKRKNKVTSVDKSNVLATSKLWRAVVKEVSTEFPQVLLTDMLVDNCAMQIIQNPAQFDVIVTANLFGDILSDAAAVLPGSLGLTPSASLNARGFGLYEPSGGSAPDIAGKGIANPIAQILSAAMMLKFSFAMLQESRAIEEAVEKTLAAGYRTADVAADGEKSISTTELTDKIIKFLS